MSTLVSKYMNGFHPSQWWQKNDHQRPEEVYSEVDIMWVYRRIDNMWSVGFYSPSGEWLTDNEYDSKEEAAERCRWLNGGN